MTQNNILILQGWGKSTFSKILGGFRSHNQFSKTWNCFIEKSLFYEKLKKLNAQIFDDYVKLFWIRGQIFNKFFQIFRKSQEFSNFFRNYWNNLENIYKICGISNELRNSLGINRHLMKIFYQKISESSHPILGIWT